MCVGRLIMQAKDGEEVKMDKRIGVSKKRGLVIKDTAA
jgi:hypothetical protein